MVFIDNFIKYKYSNHPEGTHPFEKLFGICKYGIVAGIGIGLYDAICVTDVKTPLQGINTVAYYTIPLTSMCAAFATVTFMSTNIRGKDDKWNYALGALAAGGIFKLWNKDFVNSHMVTVGLLGAALLRKHAVENEWSWIPFQDDHKIHRNYGTYLCDFSRVPERRGWTF